MSLRSLTGCVEFLKDSMNIDLLPDKSKIQYIAFQFDTLELQSQTVIIDDFIKSPHILDHKFRDVQKIAKNFSQAINFTVKYFGEEWINVYWLWNAEGKQMELSLFEDSPNPELVEDDEGELETRTFVIPTYLLSYFINGEFAELDNEELELIEGFLVVNQIDMSQGHWSYDDSEPYFSWNNDLSNVGGSVVDIEWVDMNKQDSEFDIWLSQNYIPAGEASDGEEWYLSTNPNEFMPQPLSTIKQKWESENYNQYICTCSGSNRSYVCESQTEQEAVTQMLQKFPDAQNITATLNTGRKILPRKIRRQMQLNNPPISRLDPEMTHIEF